jgi:hypothetical protein
MGLAFAAGIALGGFLGLRLGVWWALTRLGNFERKERTRRIRGK